MEVAAIDVKTEYLVLGLLEKEKGNPLSLEEISLKLNLKTDIVAHIIHSIQDKYPLCMENEKIYIPENKMRWWLVAFGIVIVDVIVFCELINHHVH